MAVCTIVSLKTHTLGPKVALLASGQSDGTAVGVGVGIASAALTGATPSPAPTTRTAARSGRRGTRPRALLAVDGFVVVEGMSAPAFRRVATAGNASGARRLCAGSVSVQTSAGCNSTNSGDRLGDDAQLVPGRAGALATDGTPYRAAGWHRA